MVINYFFSGKCYKHGTDVVVRLFAGITTQEYTENPDPNLAKDTVEKIERDNCKANGLTDVYIHFEQMNIV